MKEKKSISSSAYDVQSSLNTDNTLVKIQGVKEREILFGINRDLAGVRNRHDLVKVINSRLQQLIYFNHTALPLINGDRETFTAFHEGFDSGIVSHPDYNELVTAAHPIRDGLVDRALESELPIVIDIDDLMANYDPPLYIKVSHAKGIKEMVLARLLRGDEPIGVLVLYADKINCFDENSLLTIQELSTHVSTVVSNILTIEELQKRKEEKSILFSLGKDIASVREKKDLLQVIHDKLKKLFWFDDAIIDIINKDGNTHTPLLLDVTKKRSSDPDFIKSSSKKYPIADGIFDRVLAKDEPVIFDVDSLYLRPEKPGYVDFIYKTGVKELVGMALRDGDKKIGAFLLQLNQRNTFQPSHFRLIEGISNQLSIAVANIIALEETRKKEEEKSQLLAISNELSAVRTKEDLFQVIDHKLCSIDLFGELVIAIINDDKKTCSPYLFRSGDPGSLHDHPGFSKTTISKFPLVDGIFDMVIEGEHPVIFDMDELMANKDVPQYIAFWHGIGMREVVGVPMHAGNEPLACLRVYLKEKNRLTDTHLSFLKGVSSQIAIAIVNIMANEKIARQLEEINQYKQQLEGEKQYLQEEIDVAYNFGEIIGLGKEMQKVFHLLSQVAFTNSTVLLLGETGTGKELVARAIHSSSSRKDKVMIRVNCATLPADLVESELFGHERGSFTGAIERRIGKFELANGSTLFLDEIGEMPLNLQSKLLRALQEKEIERVGGKATIKTDVRIIAATNRNLMQEVEAGRFRRDLYYRLNVFPITIPPLRERTEDIPALASHFITRFARNNGKDVTGLSKNAMRQLQAYSWPGNVRELEHLMERSVILRDGTIIKEVYLPGIESDDTLEVDGARTFKTLEENERDHILTVLKRCNGKVSGSDGAAELLSVPSSTLSSKIKKLKITKEHFYSPKNEAAWPGNRIL